MIERRHIVAASVLALSTMAFAPHAAAQDKFPSKPVRIVVTFGAGGSGDISARTLAAQMSEALGQQVIVENRAGGGGVPGAEYVARSPADGYTILQYTNALAVNMLMRTDLSYDLQRDFVPLHYSFESPLVLVTPATSANRKLSDLVAYAKTKPEGLSYGHGGSGSMGHLSAELLKRATRINAVPVGYKGNGPAMNDLLGGRLDYYFATVSELIPLIKSGKLHALAVTSMQRAPLLPDVPTMAELGLKEASPTVGWGYFVPKGTPAPIVKTLEDAITKALATQPMQERIATLGITTQNSGGGAVMAEHVKAELARWDPVIKAANIKPD